ncbi:hypothetical protein T484DRAFT_1670798, partial [Baffinella frigidus]
MSTKVLQLATHGAGVVTGGGGGGGAGGGTATDASTSVKNSLRSALEAVFEWQRKTVAESQHTGSARHFKVGEEEEDENFAYVSVEKKHPSHPGHYRIKVTSEQDPVVLSRLLRSVVHHVQQADEKEPSRAARHFGEEGGPAGNSPGFDHQFDHQNSRRSSLGNLGSSPANLGV